MSFAVAATISEVMPLLILLICPPVVSVFRDVFSQLELRTSS